MMKKGKEYRQFYLFGIMSAVLGFGFYIPVVLWSDKALNISFLNQLQIFKSLIETIVIYIICNIIGNLF